MAGHATQLMTECEFKTMSAIIAPYPRDLLMELDP